MPLRLEIKRKLAQRSERVKFVDLHPTEPWIMSNLYSGSVCIWNYQTQGILKGFISIEAGKLNQRGVRWPLAMIR
uniref:Uncharacterized protein n=1 Tax=Arundo donax TaxID=35708 RepID=A0A0A9D4L8_ARUDO